MKDSVRHDSKRGGVRERREQQGSLSGDQPWWQQAAFYQIYPLSFQDTNGDGFGDLPGILQRVEYLSWLGIGAVWLSPVQPSPMADFGYDISDFTGIDPRFGSLADLDAVLSALHRKGIRLILDFVPNHTSDCHPWFVESRSSRDNPKRDWYVWRDGAGDGRPPNNWLSRFGGSAWEYDDRTGQFYYHAFLPQQPDLNWRNPEVRTAMKAVLRFWLERGVDGFRVDAGAVLAEDSLLRDDPPNPDYSQDTPPPEKFKRIFTDDRPETLEYLAELRQVVDEFPDRVLAGEVQCDSGRIARFYGQRQPILHLPLNYCLMDTPWDPPSLAAGIDEYLNALPEGAWPVWVLGGHDKKRIASRIGRARARAAAVLLCSLPGTPFFYAGDEIGMSNVAIPPHQVRDPFERLVPGYRLNRDPERAPMRWDGSANAGFTTGRPWLPLGDDVAQYNVETQRHDSRSILSLYRVLLRLRRESAVLRSGDYEPLPTQGSVLMYRRSLRGERLWVAANLGDRSADLTLPGASKTVLSSRLDGSHEEVQGTLRLRPNEAVILK